MAHLSRGPGAAARVRQPAPTSTARPRRKCSARRSTTVERQRAPRRQGDQLRPDVRHERVRPGQAARHRPRRGAGLHRAVLHPLSRACAISWSARASRRASSGYVETVFGRRLYLENINARNQGLRAGAERAAINAPMQGTAADIIKRAMIDDRRLAGARTAARALMVLQVHDELVFEVDAGFVDDAAGGGARAHGRRRPNCGCRWWSMRASATTGTRRTDAAWSRVAALSSSCGAMNHS